MRLLVTLAICAVCVSGESLVRHKRGWGYETTTQGWGWSTEKPTPPPPPPPTSGWGWTTQSPGWGQQPTQSPGWGSYRPPSNGWGSYSYGYNYPSYGRYPMRWGGGSRYMRESPYSRYGRDYRDVFGPMRSSSRRQLM